MGDVINTIFEIMEAREDLSLLSFDALVFIFSLGARVSASLDKVCTPHPYIFHLCIFLCLTFLSSCSALSILVSEQSIPSAIGSPQPPQLPQILPNPDRRDVPFQNA